MRVVCINDDWPRATLDEFKDVKMPVKGTIYTVRDRFIFPQYPQTTWYVFKEIVNKELPDGGGSFYEPCFPHRYFRPLDEKRIDVFRKLLVPIKSKVS